MVLILSLVSIIFLIGSGEVTEEKNAPVFSGERVNIDSLLLQSGDQEVRIKKAGTWIMEGEVESIVSERLMNDTLDNLMEMAKVSTVTSIDNVDPREFGFDKPYVTITCGFKGGRAESLIIGTSHPNGQSYYALMKGHEEIFLVGSVYPKIFISRLRKLVKETNRLPVMGPLPQSRTFDTTRIFYS